MGDSPLLTSYLSYRTKNKFSNLNFNIISIEMLAALVLQNDSLNCAVKSRRSGHILYTGHASGGQDSPPISV